MAEMESANATGRTDWETPPEFFKKYDDIFHFTVDVCANEFNHKVARYYDVLEDGLTQNWKDEVVWCNPPYGRGHIAKWVAKASLETLNGAITVMLLPARTSTAWFHKYIYRQQFVYTEFLPGRLKFVGADNSAMFPSMIVSFYPGSPI